MAHCSVCLFELFLDLLVFLHLFPKLLGAEFALLLDFLPIDALRFRLVDGVVRSFVRKFGEKPQVQERIQDALVKVIIPALHHLGQHSDGLERRVSLLVLFE